MAYRFISTVSSFYFYLYNKSDINSESIKSKYGFVIQSGGNINKTPEEQMD